MSEYIKQTIEDAQRQLHEKEAELRQLKLLINSLCLMAKQKPLYADSYLQTQSVASSLRGDEYVGEKQHSACRMILERRKALGLSPCTLDEIYADLVAGGYQFEARNDAIAKRGLSSMLSQNSTVFYRLQNQKYGLASWYPGAKRPTKKAKQESDESDPPDTAPDNGSSGEPEGEQGQ